MSIWGLVSDTESVVSYTQGSVPFTPLLAAKYSKSPSANKPPTLERPKSGATPTVPSSVPSVTHKPVSPCPVLK